MSFPFLDDFWPDELSNDSKWKIIGDTIDYAISEGITQTATQKALRNQGFTFGNTPFSTLWQHLRDFRVKFEYPTTIPVTALPDTDRMQLSYRIDSGVYQYKGSVTVYDPDIDDLYEHYFTFNSSDILTGQQAEDRLFNEALWESPPHGDIVSNVKYLGALRGAK